MLEYSFRRNQYLYNHLSSAVLTRSVPKRSVRKRTRYISISMKFFFSQAVAIGWMIFSIWVSLPWLHDLRDVVGWPLALFDIIGISYIPGYLNAFLIVSLLLDRQPKLKVENPKEPVTILIACHNEAKGIRDTLSYIKKQDYEGKINVYVVDNASTDNTRQAALKAGEEIGLNVNVFYEGKPGKNNALNTGLLHVTTPLVITLDADTILHKSAIRYIVERYLSSPKDVCAVAGAVLARNTRGNIWAKMQEWDYFLGIASVKRMQGLYQGTLVAQGAYSLYKTECVKAVGGWPNAIGEDIVLTWRMLSHGWRVYFEPLSVAFTDVPETFKHFVRQRARWARGMIEGVTTVRPWRQPRKTVSYMTLVDLLLPYLDITYTFVWLPGLVASFFGFFFIVGPSTLLVLPLTLISNAVLYRYQRYVFRQLGLRVRKNRMGFIAYTLCYQMIMSPISVWGYIQEVMNMKRVWI